MKIGILDIDFSGHPTMVDTLIQVFAANPQHEIHVFLHEKEEENALKIRHYPSSVHFHFKKKEEDVKDYFSYINSLSLDHLYVVTIFKGKLAQAIIHADFKAHLTCISHDLDLWFYLNYIQVTLRYWDLKYQSMGLFFNPFRVISCINDVYNIRRLVKYILQRKDSFGVISEDLRSTLLSIHPQSSVQVLPFSIFNGKSEAPTLSNAKLRICIPGFVEQTRRDYKGLFYTIEHFLSNYKDKVQFDILGGCSDPRLLRKMRDLKALGFDLLFSESPYLPLANFNRSMDQADIILGNLVRKPSLFGAYGKSKEAGTPYLFISAAKPALIPSFYKIFDKLKSSVIYYDSRENLAQKIIELIHNPQKLELLQRKALENAEKYRPEIIEASLRTQMTTDV